MEVRFNYRPRTYASICVLTINLLSSAVSAKSTDPLECLFKAYPEHLTAPTESHYISGRAGQRYPYDPNTVFKDYENELNNADLYSQLRQQYQTGSLAPPPQENEDPGRLRHTPLFLDMYGRTSSEVASKLVTINWKPCNCAVQFSRVNGASHALEAVGNQIHQEGLSRYVNQNMGTFNWRNIAGTHRLSMHAFGIAIDFNLPTPLGRYWRWDRRMTQNKSVFPKEIMNDEGFNRVVAIFESHGFVWGGKWWHYDSIHFEYRPELTLHGCSSEGGGAPRMRNQE